MVTFYGDKMNRKELENDTNMQKWKILLEQYSTNPQQYWTKCLTSMMYFTEMTEKTPEQLIVDAKDELGKPLDERELTFLIPKFKTYLERGEHIKHDATGKRKKLSPKSVYLYVAAVKSFYDYHYIPVPKTKGKKRIPKTKNENDAIPSIAEIRDFLEHCNPMEKALVLCAESGGLGAAELSSLKVSTFWDGYDKNTGITTLFVTRPKTDIDFYTFLSPEASKAVIEYLDERDAPAKYDTKFYIDRAKKTHTTNDSYLFIHNKITDEYLETGNEELRYLNPDLIRARYREVNRKAKISTKKGSYNNIRAHTVRKLFNKTLKLKGCNNAMVEFWMGHKLDDTQSAYFFKTDKVTPEDIVMMKEMYTKYYPFLIVQMEKPIAETPEYQRLEEKNLELEAENARIQVERSEHDRLREQVATLMQYTGMDTKEAFVTIKKKKASEEEKYMDDPISHDVKAFKDHQKEEN